MKRIVRSPYGEWMPAKIQIKGDKVRVSPKGKQPVVILRKNTPKTLRPGTWEVQFNESKKSINNWKPIKGVFRAKVQKFASKEDEAPMPKIYRRTNQYGHEYEVEEFVTILEIVDGEAKGATLTYNLPFKFDYDEEEIDGNVKRTLQIAGRGKATDKLEEFLRVNGVWNKTLPYKDNPLPMLEKVILSEAKEFNVQVEKGWVSSIYASDLPDEDTDFDGENAPWEE